MAMANIDTLDALHDRYDAILCDVWGVLHNGVVSWPAACEALQRARKAGKTVILITHETTEQAIRKAIEGILQDGHLVSRPQVIRIERAG